MSDSVMRGALCFMYFHYRREIQYTRLQMYFNCIAVKIAELQSCEMTYWIIDGICNQHYDNQWSHQDENTLKESEKHQSKVLFIDFKKGEKIILIMG